MKPSKVGNLFGKMPLVINGTWRHLVWQQYTIRDGDTVIILTEGGSLVHNTRSIRVSNVGVNKDPKGFILVLEKFSKL